MVVFNVMMPHFSTGGGWGGVNVASLLNGGGCYCENIFLIFSTDFQIFSIRPYFCALDEGLGRHLMKPVGQ